MEYTIQNEYCSCRDNALISPYHNALIWQCITEGGDIGILGGDSRQGCLGAIFLTIFWFKK